MGNITESVYSDFGFLYELRYYEPGSDPDIDSPDEVVDYTYNSLDQRSQISDARGDTDYTYDEFDRRQSRFVRASTRSRDPSCFVREHAQARGSKTMADVT
ncbi:hypothetical protein Pan258_10020 [Symmachiella dynata]|uniref:hypothetical protein n=1 Tax=Symmachiella dynata TaxID=2527995 RepID=UPI00118CADCF|nr:hypothetical protein [Symmachiella dynata]QDT46977.1 hypothetical protein Pan258_10020 [Symmachiella dynata]